MKEMLAAAALLLVALASGASAGERSLSLDRCVHAGPHTHIIRFRTPGGHRTAAAVLGAGTRGVVLSNQSGNYLCPWLPFARALAARGLRVLLYNYRWGTESQEAISAAAGRRRSVAGRGVEEPSRRRRRRLPLRRVVHRRRRQGDPPPRAARVVRRRPGGRLRRRHGR